MKLNQPPAWRWQRAKELVTKRLQPSRRCDDKMIIKAWKYQRRFRKDDPRVEHMLSYTYPHIHQAKQLWLDVYSGMRWIFEAGVMADKPVEELSEYLNADVEVLKVYEELFFDVRSALSHKGCIAANVLMPVFKSGATPKDPDFGWKLVAFEGGWEVVRSMWEVGDVTPAAADFINKTFREQVIRTGREAAFTVVPNGFNSVDLIKTAIDLLKFDHESGGERARDQTQSSMGALLGSIQLTVHGARERLDAEEPRRQLPRASDIEIVDVSAEPVAEKVQKESE